MRGVFSALIAVTCVDLGYALLGIDPRLVVVSRQVWHALKPLRGLDPLAFFG